MTIPTKTSKSSPPPTEDEVLRRMLGTPPTPHKPTKARAKPKKRAK